MADLNNPNEYKKTIDSIQQELQRGYIISLKRKSNELVEYSVTKNQINVLYLSLICYILYKILAQDHIVNNKSWDKSKQKILYFLDSIEKKQISDLPLMFSRFKILFRNDNKELFNYINNISKKGKVKISARLYEMGLSQKKILSIFNVNLYDLQSYLTNTLTHNLKSFETLIAQKVAMLTKEFD